MQKIIQNPRRKTDLIYFNESLRKRIQKQCQLREQSGWTWQDLADWANEQPDNYSGGLSSSFYRKHYDYDTGVWYPEMQQDNCPMIDDVDDSTPCQLTLFDEVQNDTDSDVLRKIKIEKIKLSDERIQNNAIIRRIAREETIKEIAQEAAKQVAQLAPMCRYQQQPVRNSEMEGILQISDWHYGIDIDSPFNKYNPSIAIRRVNQLFSKVLDYCDLYNLDTLHVVNLSDMIAGNIHLPLRLNSRIDVITQIMNVSELIAEGLALLSRSVKVHYYDTLDNHSRLEPVKNNSIDLESLCRITTWYLKERLQDNKNIIIHDNEFGDDIITFECLGHKVVGVHGHKDKPMNVVDNMALMTKQYYDLVLTAHLHHFQADEKNECIVLSNGSLMGTDKYAQDLRLSARPSQNFVLVTKQNVIDTIHRILVD